VGAVTAQTGSILVKIVGTTMDTPSAPSGVWSKIDSGSQTTTNPLTTASITTGSHTISVPGITGYTESYDTCTFTGTTECSMPTASAYSPMSCSGGTCSASVSVSANTTTKVAVLYTITVATNQPDTTPPSVPTSVAATAISSSQINLSWAASSDNTGVAGYKIYRAGTQIGTSVGNSYSDVGLSASTAYSYAVFAYDAAGNSSAASASASATTQAAPAPSANPTTHTITSSAGTGGTISPLGSTSVTSGGSQTFTIVPSSGYQVSSVIVDGASVGAVTSYPFSNVTATHSISANFTAMLPSAQNFVFTRVLRIGSYGEDVRQLQIFLNAHGFIIASSGNGSSGNETTYYGRATALAVSRFQVAHASEILAPYGLTRGTGYFGLATMKVVNALIAAGE
jgi:fibronectin type 3 domain-containing protein